MIWPTDDPLETVRPMIASYDRMRSLADIQVRVDDGCPKGIIWFYGSTILRLDPNTHDAHIGAVGGE